MAHKSEINKQSNVTSARSADESQIIESGDTVLERGRVVS